MLDTPTQSQNALLRYWLQGLWRNYLNAMPLQSEILANFAVVSTQEVANGHFSFSLSSIPDSGKVWIAPVVFEKEGGELWIPLWLPAILNHTMLFIDNSSHRLPWIPACQFEKGMSNIFSESLHEFDEWLRYEYLQENEELTWGEWPGFYQAVLEFLEALSNGVWRQVLNTKGFSVIDKSLIISEEKLASLHSHATASLSLQLSDNTVAPLLNHYATIEESEAEPIFDEAQLKEKSALFCGSMAKKHHFTHQEYQALIHALSGRGNLLAITATISSSKVNVVRTIIASVMVQEALTRSHSLEIYLLASRSAAVEYDLTFEKCTDKITKNLEELHALFLDNIHLADYQPLSCNPEIKALQEQDESAEKALSALLFQQKAENQKVKNRSVLTFFSRLFLRTGFQLKKQKSYRDLSDKIRQIKVQRTKIHQQLVNVVENNATSKNLPLLTYQLFSLAREYWQNISVNLPKINHGDFSSRSLLKLHVGEQLTWESVDKISNNALLIVDETNRFLPQEIAPYLACVSSAIFLGDSDDLPPKPVISALQEEKDMEVFGFTDEELIEQLHYKGQLQGTGNAFTLAMANNHYQELTEYGSWNSVLSLNTERNISCKIIPVTGQSEQVGIDLCNQLEAQTLVDWLTTEPFHSSTDAMIVTPFWSQKILLKALLEKAGLALAVFVTDELPSREWEHVIFSPVYTVHDRRPFVFDQGDYYIYSLLARTKKTFWIVGNQDLFDSKMHSPSGNLAKRLFSHKSTVVPRLVPLEM